MKQLFNYIGVAVDLAPNANEDKKKSEPHRQVDEMYAREKKDSMTPEQIFKKYKIPEATVEEIYTKRGRVYDRDKQTSSIRNKRFVSELKSAIDKYGAPIKIDKQNVNTYNEHVARYNAFHELEYEYLKGTIVDVTFKDSKGRTYVVSSYRSRLSL